MAQCFGQSGCWKTIVSQLKELKLSIHSPEQFYQVYQLLEHNLSMEIENIEKSFQSKYLFFKEALKQTRHSAQCSIVEKSFEVSQQLSQLHQNIKNAEMMIEEITQKFDQELSLHLQTLTTQVNRLNIDIKLIENQIDALNTEFKQHITTLALQNKPAWYRIFARIKYYFSLKKQYFKLNKTHQNTLKLYHLQSIDLTDKKNDILKRKQTLETQYTKHLENARAPFRRDIEHNKLKKHKLNAELEHLQQVHLEAFKKLQREMLILEENKQLTIEEKTKETTHKIAQLKDIRESPTYKGAIAELEMIDFLKKLPNNYFVFNDVLLHSYNHYFHNGKLLKSSQIDHLVVSPAGVFIIEVKFWNKKFIETNDYFSPYEQVERASKLCWLLLKDDFEQVKTRSIIAYKDSIPHNESSYVKTLKIPYVNQYITDGYFQSIFTDAQLYALVNYFKNKVNHYGT